MLRNIVTISTILVILAFPYAIFISMSFFTRIPKYPFRIAFIFINVSRTTAMQTVKAFVTAKTMTNTNS
jgi:hypothetical protein